MSTVYNDPIMLDSTGQDIVTKLDSIATLMGDGVIDDTSTTATDKTWSASKENTVVNGLQSNVIANTKLIKDTVGWSGKNKGKYINQSLVGDATLGFNLVTGGSSLIAKIENNKDYVVQKKNEQGDRFRIVLFPNVPPTVVPDKSAVQLINDYTKNNYTFNSGNYNYAVFTYVSSSSTAISQDTAEAMICDADILDNTYEPYFGSTAFPRSEQAVLGAKNIWDDSDLRANFTTFTKTNNGYRVQSSQSDTYTYMASFFTLPDEVKGKDLIFSTTVTKTSGQNFIVVDASNDGTNFTKFFETGATGNISRTYNCDSYSIYRVRFFVTLDTAAVGDVTFGDIMIRLASDPDDTYAPYAMTNRELTDKVAFNNVEITNVNAGITLDTVWSYAYQVGNLVMYALRFTVGESAIAENTILCSFGAECSKSMNADILPRQTGNHFLAALVADTTNHRTDFKTFGGATLTASNEYLVSGIYIAK